MAYNAQIKPVKFICGFIYSRLKSFEPVKIILTKRFGTVDFESPAIDFNFTDYYQQEMGKALYRKFLSFKNLRDPGEFAAIKQFCIKIEKKSAKEGKRTVNVDPGYLTEAKLILTTTKDFAHRIYLNKGIYAEVTLIYQKGKFCDLPTTFPDYRTKQYKEIFIKLRDIYRKQIHSKNNG